MPDIDGDVNVLCCTSLPLDDGKTLIGVAGDVARECLEPVEDTVAKLLQLSISHLMRGVWRVEVGVKGKKKRLDESEGRMEMPMEVGGKSEIILVRVKVQGSKGKW